LSTIAVQTTPLLLTVNTSSVVTSDDVRNPHTNLSCSYFECGRNINSGGVGWQY